MVVSFRVFKKASPNGRLTVYLGRRDFIDHVTECDPVDGVLLIEEDYLKGRQVSPRQSQAVPGCYPGNCVFQIYCQLVCSFRYGKEDDETMGLSFKKELVLADEQVYPPSHHKGTQSKLQERLMKKLGHTSFPFQLHFPRHSPTSVTLLPGPDDKVRYPEPYSR